MINGKITEIIKRLTGWTVMVYSVTDGRDNVHGVLEALPCP